MNSESFLPVLESGIAALGEDAARHPCRHYLRFLDLLLDWNRKVNLTAIREPRQAVAYHLLDSVSMSPYLHGVSALDIGSGGGLPGLVLAMARPAMRWTLLDSNGKKIRFLEHAIAELGIANAEAVHGRLGQFRLERRFDTAITRAVALTPRLARAVRPVLADDGLFLAMKGARPTEDVTASILRHWTVETLPLRVPGVTSERNLLRLKPRPAAGSA